MKDKNKEVAIKITYHEEEIEHSMKLLAIETLILFDGMSKELGREVQEKAFEAYLTNLCSVLISKEMTGLPKTGTKHDQYVAAKNKYNNIKNLIQDGMAAGFSDGLSKYAGKMVDYYCVIRPVGDAVNKVAI